MPTTKSSSSSPADDRGSRATHRLLSVPLDRLRPHPANPNRMSDELLKKLETNIAREGDYEPLTVRPRPGETDYYQILGGHQRKTALQRLGHDEALCYVWPCDDATALRLLLTLNRLEGQDDPMKRAEILLELSALAAPEELAQLLPEDASTIRRSSDWSGKDWGEDVKPII